MMPARLKATFTLALLVVLGAATNAHALVMSGHVQLYAPPPTDARWEALENNDHTPVWLESSNLAVANAFGVDVIPFLNNASGLYNNGNVVNQSAWAGSLGADTYSSYFLHADKQGKNRTYAGSITFDETIEGLVFRRTNLNLTEAIFGAAGTAYATGSVARFELTPNASWFQLSDDFRTLTFQTYVPHDLDNLRIITGTPTNPPDISIPVPGTTGLIGLGLLMARRFLTHRPSKHA